MRAEAGVGSFNQRLANLSATTNYGPWSTSFYGNAIKSDGYRENNALDQRNGVGNLNYTTPDLKAFLTVTGDDQKLGLPGGRLVDPSIGLNELVTNRRGAATPFDYGNQQGASATAGFTKTILNGVDLIVDGGVRKKDTQSGFFGAVPFASPLPSFSSTYNDASLQTWSIERQELDARRALSDPDRHRLLRCDVPPGSRGVQGPCTDQHLRSVAADAGRLLAAHRRPVADH
jgi:iron complex outermembrane receptor protein